MCVCVSVCVERECVWKEGGGGGSCDGTARKCIISRGFDISTAYEMLTAQITIDDVHFTWVYYTQALGFSIARCLCVI